MSASVPRTSRAVPAAVALIALMLALVALLAALFAWQGRRDARAAVEARASSAAYTASMYVRMLIEGNLQALQRVAEHVERRPDLLASATVQDLNDAVAALPGSAPIWVFDAQGASVLTNELGVGPANIGDRGYFQALREGPQWHIGALVIGRTTGRKFFPIGRRIERDGGFAGAVIIYVPAETLAEFWESLHLGPGSTVGLIRDDGWLVARYPVPDAPINLAGYALFTEHLSRASQGTYGAEASPADGTARIVGYRRVEGLPLVTVVGVPTSAFAQGLGRRLAEVLLAAAPIALALLVVSLWVVRLLRKEETARGALAEALEQNRTLFREIHHRVKNNLQTVSALVQLQPGETETKQELIRRIAAMTAVHEHIYGSDQFESLEIAEYVRRLVARLREGYGSTVTVDCDLDPVRIGADQALPLGLILNEVVSNAFKHAFPDGRGGRIAVTLKEEAGEVRLTVRDDGVGAKAEAAQGMGSRLVRGLTQQLGGTSSVRQDGGTVFELAFPRAEPTPVRPYAQAA
jgi:two-component system, sensor histidine kinase PdtaS